jgi:predicted DNA-binding WGR domain protein
MKHYLIYQDEQSSKLWQLEKSENCLTVTYGKTGSVMSSLVATFESESECSDTTELLIGEKLKKGYKVIDRDSVAI